MYKKLRWLPHIISECPVLAYVEFVSHEEPTKIKIWGQIIYIPEIDRFGVSYMNKDRVQLYTDQPYEVLCEAMTAVEQQLFEEGVREDA